MALQNEQLLKRLQSYKKEIPLFLSFLEREGFSRQLIHYYVKNKWLYKITEGIYSLSSSKVEALNVVKAVQQQLNNKITIGAQSSLYLQGKAHFLKTTYQLFLYLNGTSFYNKWIMNNPNYKLIKKQIFSITNKDSLIENKGVLITSTERALIEMADLVPKQATFEEFVKIMELCAGSRPTLVQELLINCTAVKAKRIFLMVAEYVNHPWFKKLDISKIDLGKGDRQIVKNGTYNKKYKICVPNINHYEL